MTGSLQVHLVTPSREVWSGPARIVIARSVEGDLGVLPRHAPLLACLDIGPVRIQREGQDDLSAIVDGGFLSVSQTGDVTQVYVLAEHVTLESDIHADDIEALERHAEQLRLDGQFAAARTVTAKALVRRRLSS